MNFIKARKKVVVLLLSCVLLMTAVFSGTLAYVVTGTHSLLNTFLSGLDPTGDLTIRKTVEHPFGGGYVIPEEVSFSFLVNLGENYAGKVVSTSQGERQADEKGCITVTVKPEEAVSIPEIREGTSVTVTEILTDGSGFAVKDGVNPKTVTIGRDDREILFTNTYTPAKVGPVNLSVTGVKVLDGRDWQEGDRFTFLLEYKLAGEGAQWQELGTTDVAYEQIQVQDPAFPDDPDKTIWVDKPDFDKFDFTELVQGVEYTAAGEYSFRVSEVDGTIGGITYDKVVSYFDVLVGDEDMDGALEIQDVKAYQNASAEYNGNEDMFRVNVTVNNTYAPEGTATVQILIDKIVRSLSGEEKSYAGYTFELYDEDGVLLETSEQTSAAGEAAIELIYDATDAGRTFYYVLKETDGGEVVEGMRYDDREYKLLVSVVDNLDGTVSAYIYKTEADIAELPEYVVIPADATDTYRAGFENVYDPENAQIILNGTKKLEGRALNSGEFRFDLYDTGDDTTPVQSVVNAADGSFTFAAINYDKVGIYRYAVKEDSSGRLGGVTYDDETFHVVVTVTDVNGVLKADAAITDHLGAEAEVTFCNTYTAAKTSVIFNGTKKLTGGELQAGMFEFLLYEADEEFNAQTLILEQTSNTADGSFAFKQIEYSEAGDYFYVITEDLSEPEEGYTYDETAYGVKVSVTDNGQGRLVADVAIHELGGEPVEAIVFENSYTQFVEPTEPSKPTEPTNPSKPTEPDSTDPTNSTVSSKPTDPTKPDDPNVPDTGDHSGIELYQLMMFTSLAAIAALVIVKVRKKDGHE